MNNELENISVMNYYKDYKLICDNMKPNMGNLIVGYMSFVIAIAFVIYTFVFKDGSFASKFFGLILALIFIGFGFVQVMSANMFKKTAEKFLKELEEDIENPEYETTKIVFYGQGHEYWSEQPMFPPGQLNRDLLHSRWILYQLSYWENPSLHIRNPSCSLVV